MPRPATITLLIFSGVSNIAAASIGSSPSAFAHLRLGGDGFSHTPQYSGGRPAVATGSSMGRRALSHRILHNIGQRMSSMLNESNNNESKMKEKETFGISIEYCSACQWTLRASWIASEVLTTFSNEPRLVSISLNPMSPPFHPGGIFRISASSSTSSSDEDAMELWDRKKEGRFPESKEVKQSVRDLVNPDKNLGHSDVAIEKKSYQQQESSTKSNEDSVGEVKQADCVECQATEQLSRSKAPNKSPLVATSTRSGRTLDPTINHVTIEYSASQITSTENGLYRATWYAQELLSMVYERNAWYKAHPLDQSQNQKQQLEHNSDIPIAVDRVTLIPNRKETDVLRIHMNDNILLYDKNNMASHDAAFCLDANHLKKCFREAAALGHIEDNGDATIGESGNDRSITGENNAFVEMSDEEAENARRFFGVM